MDSPLEPPMLSVDRVLTHSDHIFGGTVAMVGTALTEIEANSNKSSVTRLCRVIAKAMRVMAAMTAEVTMDAGVTDATPGKT